MAYYRDLREYLKALDEKDKPVQVSRPLNTDTKFYY